MRKTAAHSRLTRREQQHAAQIVRQAFDWSLTLRTLTFGNSRQTASLSHIFGGRITMQLSINRSRFKLDRRFVKFQALLLALIITLTAASLSKADTGTCGGTGVTLPFTDVAGNSFFCQIAAAYFSGLTNGTTPTTYSPSAPVTREQMAAFVSRTLDQSLKRGSRRAALKQLWTSEDYYDLPLTAVGSGPEGVACDGADVWVASTDGNISRVRASDGKRLEVWTGAIGARRVLVAKGRVYVIGHSNGNHKLYRIDPTKPAGAVTPLNVNFGNIPVDIAFDGVQIWITSSYSGVYILSFSAGCNPCVTNVTTGFSNLSGIVYDGANIWVADRGDNQLKKLSASGNVIQSVPVGLFPGNLVCDSTNIWVLRGNNAVTVVRAATGAVVATLTGNGLDGPFDVAFDGERILVTNAGNSGSGHTVSLWKATDLSPLGSFTAGAVGAGVASVCSDGLNFWIALHYDVSIVRF
jgi:hypothetical protein